MSKFGPLALFSLSPEYADFANYVASYLETTVRECDVSHWKDGAMNVDIPNSVRGSDVFVLQPYMPPQGEREKALYFFLDAAKYGGAADRVTVVQPYCFEQRSDGVRRPREPTGALIIARNLKANGASGTIMIEQHSTAVGGYYKAERMHFESLKFSYLTANYIIQKAQEQNLREVVIASPDAGAAKRNQSLLDLISDKAGIVVRPAYGDKARTGENVKFFEIIGKVQDANVFICDDIGDTLGTMEQVAKAIREKGAKHVYSIITHPVLGDGYEKRMKVMLESGTLDEMIFGNTLPLKDYAANHPKVRCIPLEPFVAQAIKHVHEHKSLSRMHDYDTIIGLYDKKSPSSDPKLVPIVKTSKQS